MAYDLFYIAALIIAVLTVFLLIVFYSPISRIKNSLMKACGYLNNEWKIQENSTFFLQDGYRLFSNKRLKELWARYLISINNHNGNYRYANIYEYFSPDNTIEEITNTGLASFAPLILFFLGLITTAASLIYYSVISKLTKEMWIEASILITVTTLIALGMTMYYKNLVYAARNRLRAFSQWITLNHQAMPGIAEQLADVRDTMRSYNDEQQKFYASLTDNIADNTIKAIKPFLEETKQTIGFFISATTERQIESMKNLAEYFADTTTQLYLDQIQKISETTASMAEIQSKTAETLQSVTTIYTESKDCIQQVGDASNEVLEKYDNNLTQVTAMNETLTKSVSLLEDLVEYIRNNSRNQNFTIENLTKFQQDLLDVSNKSTNSMKEFFDDFKDQYSSYIISLRAASGDMLKAGELLKGSYTGLAMNVNQEVEQVFHTFDENLATISLHLSQSINDLQEAIDEFPEVLRRINTNKD